MSDATDCSIFYTSLSLKGRSSNPERFDTTVKFTISCDWWLSENFVWPAFLIYFSFLISDTARHWFFPLLLGKQSPTISTIVTLAESLLSSIYWHFVDMKNSTARSWNSKTFLTMKKMTWGGHSAANEQWFRKCIQARTQLLFWSRILSTSTTLGWMQSTSYFWTN